MEDKEKFANAFIDLFESRTGAKIRDHVEEIEIVSPASYARYSSTPLGNIYGYEVSPVDGAVLRTLLVDEEQYIPGLDFVGTYGRRCHSFGCGIVNGLEVTKDTLKKLGKEKK
jgi:prolycopene isomerase